MPLAWNDFIAGYIGGAAGLIASHPLDTLKVRQQAFGTSLWKTAKTTYKHEGVRGYYKGMLVPLLAVGPSTSVFFGVYQTVLQWFMIDNQEKNFQTIFTAASFAGFCQVLITCPVELTKTVLQAKTANVKVWGAHYRAPYGGTLEAFIGIFRERGLPGIYRGMVPTIWRDVPTSGVYLLTYEMLRYSRLPKDIHDWWKDIIAGGTAGFVSCNVVLPFDVVKSRMQADNPKSPLYKGFADCFCKIYKQNGLLYFFKGFRISLYRAFCNNAIVFLVFQNTKVLLTWF